MSDKWINRILGGTGMCLICYCSDISLGVGIGFALILSAVIP